jgi:hypothetical protein
MSFYFNWSHCATKIKFYSDKVMSIETLFSNCNTCNLLVLLIRTQKSIAQEFGHINKDTRTNLTGLNDTVAQEQMYNFVWT